MMWMPLRASKMNGFIFGFHRLVWCPKWTPESNNSFTPMLITSFPLVRSSRLRANHPAEHGIFFSVVMTTSSNLEQEFKAVKSPFEACRYFAQPSKKTAEQYQRKRARQLLFFATRRAQGRFKHGARTAL